jgi:hypothetical protein
MEFSCGGERECVADILTSADYAGEDSGFVAGEFYCIESERFGGKANYHYGPARARDGECRVVGGFGWGSYEGQMNSAGGAKLGGGILLRGI